MAQSGDTRVPRLIVAGQLQTFLQSDEFRQLSPCGAVRFRVGDGENAFSIPPPNSSSPRVLLAVGPDKGWCPTSEMPLLDQAGFTALGIGPRLATQELKACAAIAIAAAMTRRWTSHTERAAI